MGLVQKYLARSWIYTQQAAHKRFLSQSKNIFTVQDQKLKSYLVDNKGTQFGSEYDFGAISTYEQYQKNIPIINDYKELKPYIDRIASGAQSVLTVEKVLFFETTSSSSGHAKMIPYTAKLKTEFQEAVAVWMVDLYRQYPRAFYGHQYWSLSPPTKEHFSTTSGIPVGIDSDLEYFGKLESLILDKIMAIPSRLSSITKSSDFYFALCSHLLAKDDLSFISVWSPSYLLKVHEFISENLEKLLVQTNVTQGRKDQIRHGISMGNWKSIFPKLEVMSCWTDAQASLWLPEIRRMMEGVHIQGKGLLATEGVTSIPINGYNNALAFTSHFYEFLDIESGETVLSQSVIKGRVYEIILTTGGGLYRYNTHDLVEITGFMASVPCFNFLGRSGGDADMVGEKFSEKHALEILKQLHNDLRLTTAFGFHPYKTAQGAGYELLVSSLNDGNLIVGEVEHLMKMNPYYKQAIDLGQLLPLKVNNLGEKGSLKVFNYYCQTKQIKEGDAKLPTLFPVNFLEDFRQ